MYLRVTVDALGSTIAITAPATPSTTNLKVATACRGFEKELQDLWSQRPRVMDITAVELGAIVCQDIALKLEELFSVYAAAFWVHFIYIHRVAWWNLPHSNIAKTALEETWRMLRRSRGQSERHTEEEEIGVSCPRSAIHPGLMWPLLLFGCETPDPFRQDWAVTRLKKLREASAGGQALEEKSNNELPSFRLAEKGAQNAMRASVVLKELVQRQTKLGARIDGNISPSSSSGVISRLYEMSSKPIILPTSRRTLNRSDEIRHDRRNMNSSGVTPLVLPAISQ